MRFVRNSLALALVCLALLSGCEGLSVDTVKRVAADVAGSGDTGTAAEDTADDVADTAADSAVDTAPDTAADTTSDTGGAAANGCGGAEPLAYRGAAASPGDACGLCGDGELFCSGTSGLSCAGASLPNACGGCGLVEGEIGTACGLCGDGVWACGAGQAECVGDRPWNACAGCAPLAEEPGTECLLVGGATGLVVCVGRESSVCASLGTNACGGQGELALPAGVTGVLARPGVRYEVGCVRGVLVCNGEELEALPIEGENGCGGCEPLAGTPGGACGACGGVWTCDVDGGVRCVGGAANACGGCAALTSEPGLQCDAGGNAGITICISLEETACVVPGSTNACGGLGSLTGAALGATCGPCSDGVVVCDAADPRRRSTLCETVSSSANACGGCGLLDGIPGSACGTCGLGLLACNATDDGLDCTGNPGASALNACGGCSTLAAAPGDLCGRCGLWGCDPEVVGRLRCDEPAAGCASVAVCGNAAVESGEACDDGNSVTEECLYGERTCSICDATCQTAAGRASFCGDGALDLVEVCDEGGANGTGACAISCDCSAGYHVELGACVSDTRSCSITNGTGSESWTGSAYGSCTVSSCNATYHLESGACVSDTRSCTLANATAATQAWTGSAYGTCTATACASTYHVESGACVSDTRSCVLANGTGTQTWSGAAYGTCTPVSCNASYHIESGACVSDTRSCSSANATVATQTWNSGTSSYGTCTATACAATYHVESGACVSDTRSCTLANATTATQTWNSVTSSYGSCTATACASSYHLESGACVSDTRSCSIGNGTGSQSWTGSAYGTCTATACDIGYHTESGTCVSDTRSCSASNATAATESWTGTGYGVCIISACSAGYALVANSCVGGCGNGVIGSGETCDDGNSVTEVCNYGELACRVCDATCQFVSGVTAYCSDGLLHPTEFCDDGNNNDADACNNSCACGAGFHAEGGVCTTNQRVCIINNRTGAETWNVITGTYGSCIAPVCGDGHLIDLGSIGFPVGARVVISDTLWGSSDDLAGGCGANSGAEDVVVFVAPTTGDYVARTAFLGTIADTSVRILSDCGAAESQIACGAEGAAVGDWRGEVAFSAIAGLTYYLLVEAERGTEAPYVLEVSSVPVVTAATARYLTATNVAFSIAGVDVDQDVASIDVYAVATTGGVLPPTAERSLVATFVRSGLSYNPTAGFSTNLELTSALGSTVTSVELVAVDAAGNKSAPFAIAAPLYTAPTAVASGATCDPTQQLTVCTAPQDCTRQSNAIYICAAARAPSLASATVTRVDLTTASVRLTGFDTNADVNRFRAEFYTATFGRLGQIEGNLSATLLGQANYDVTFPLTGVNNFPTATQIRFVAIDQRGLVSNQLAAPLAGFADRTAGQLCDPSGIANRCATGLSCQPKQDGGNACIAPAEPVITGFAASIAEPGLAVFGPVSGFDADGGLTTLVVEWSLSGGGIIRQEYPISGFSFLVSGIYSFVGVAPISVSFTVVDALGNRVSATVPALADTGAPAVP